MQRALELGLRGQGCVEPNPMVGCVIVRENRLLGEGWHQCFGGPHAEVNAIASAGCPVAGSTVYVTLEPCAHTGKTPPCADALIAAGVTRVVVAHPDPNPQVAGAGIRKLKDAGIEVEIGLLQVQAAELLAPYLKLTTKTFPWIIGKWAMTWDGKIATSSGDSKWISNAQCRTAAHQTRGRVDAIMVGINTVLRDDPLLTARPQGPRVAMRVILDSNARLPLDCQICQTAKDVPTLIAVGSQADPQKILQLRERGCEVWMPPFEEPDNLANASVSTPVRLLGLLEELAQRGMTNILAEGGGQLLGSLFDLGQIDEVHLFIGGKLIGGQEALSPVGGRGVTEMLLSQSISLLSVAQFENDLYVVGRVNRN
jgi:diaminohydroxyphosphoribosylaminopyrimidine deaminase / 5-amino-6-(5-phosphoribosylamino)uracil reductase